MVQTEKVINIKIPAELHKNLRIHAAMKSQTLRDFIIKVLEKYVKNQGDINLA